MQLEVVQMVTDWLRQPGPRGYAGRLASVPVKPGTQPAPAAALIVSPYDDTDDGNACAAWKPPGKLPALYVTPDGPILLEGEVATNSRDADRVAIAIRYVTRGNDARSRIEASYACRAVIYSIREMLRQDADANAARTSGGIYIRLAQSIVWSPWLESIGTAQAIAVVGVEFAVRDKSP